MNNVLSVLNDHELSVVVSTNFKNLSLRAKLSQGSTPVAPGRTDPYRIPGPLPLNIENVEFGIDYQSTALFFMIGFTFDFELFGELVDVTARMNFGPTSAAVVGTVRTPNGTLPSPPILQGIHFSEIGLLMGVGFAPPSIMLGLGGKFEIGDNHDQKDRFSFVLEIIGNVPNPLYLSFYLKHISMSTIVTVFTDHAPPAGAREELEIIHGDELSFYWSERAIILPDGTYSQPGLEFSGFIDIFSFDMFTDCEVTSSDIHGKAQTDPINILGLLKIEGDGTEIKRKYNTSTGLMVDNHLDVENNDAEHNIIEKTVVHAGGPHFEMGLTSSPILKANWRISLFEVVKQQVNVSVGLDGIEYELKYSIMGISKFVLACKLKKWTDFTGSTSFKYGLDHKFNLPLVGSINVEATVGAHFEVKLNTQRAEIGISDLGFHFMGMDFVIPDITLDVHFSSLQKIPEIIINEIVANAAKIFAQILTNPEILIRLIRDGIINTIKNLAQLLGDLFGIDTRAIADILKGAGYVANEVASILKDAGIPVDEIAGILKDVFKLSGGAIGEVLKGVGFVGSQVAGALKAIGIPVDQIAGILKSTFGMGVRGIGTVLKGLGYAGSHVAGALKSIGIPVNQISDVLKVTFGFGANAVGNVLKGVGYTANQVAGALKAVGFPAEAVARFLKDGFSMGAEAVKGVLEGVGFAGSAIEGAFKAIGGSFASFAEDVWGSVGEALNPSNW